MPNPLSNFFSRLVPPTKEKLTELPAGWSTSNHATGLENFTDSRSLTSYKESLYLYIAVSKISKRMASIPLELHKIKGTKGDTEEVFDHEILDLFYNPNDLQTQRTFLETSCAHYLLSGDAFWYINRDDMSMVTLRPDQMEIILNKGNKGVVAYEHRAGTVTRFKPEDIVHIQNPDPTNILRGVGAVRPAHVRIITEKAAGEYQANWLKNQGRPDVAVFVDGVIDDEKGKEGRRKWLSTFGKNGGGVGFFGNIIKSIQELNKTPVEMGLMDTQNFLRDDILAALGVPKGMVTSDDVNMANAKEAYKMFLQEAVVPVLDAFIDVINNRMLPRFDQALFFRFDDPTPNDRELILKETTELKKNGIITANEARANYDYESIDGADNLATAQVRPAVQEEAKAIIRRRPLLAKRLKAKELAVEALMSVSTAPERKLNSIFPTKSLKDGYAKAYNKRVDKKAEGLKAAIDTFHEAQLKRILENDLTVDGFMDVQAEKIAARAYFTPILREMYKSGGQEALDAVFKKSADNFWADEVLLAAISARADFFTNSMTETTFAVLGAKIADGLKAGNGPDTIASDIRGYFTDMTKGRAETIARTETGYTLSKASHDAYQQSSVITGMEWITVGDAKVRPEHQENNGQIVAKGGTFASGESYPAQHSINCRCVLGPTV
ncbi:phage portal protein [Sulfitobacter sp. 1A10445]|uniref:phage portal protein n=1 Tax=unclassified Sulfitobacter TaxID=196795 RepID=UPI0037461BAA